MPVLIALMHDILIVSGVYALVGREVTTSTVAALLTILGYSLYDTIIVFDRVRENIPRMPSAAFSQIVNRSMSEVITRSLATSFCTLLPILSLLLFGGETLQDFAFALLIGVASGTYSSIFIATPVLTHWKEREPGFRARHARILETLGEVPAYATVAQGGPVDVAPKDARQAPHHHAGGPGGLGVGVPGDGARPRDRGGAGAEGGGGASRSRRPRARVRPAAGARGRGRTGRAPPAGTGARRAPPENGDSDAEGAQAAQPPPREAALMAMLVWVMVGLAIWHFTIFLPDNFYGGIVGAFCGALLGSIIFGIIVNLGSIPGQSGTDLVTGLEAVPGSVIGLAVVLVARRARAQAAPGRARSPDGPQPVARARQRGAQVAGRRPERGRQLEVAAGDPHAPGVVAWPPSP